MKKVSIIVPAYNEEKRIKPVLEKYASYFKSKKYNFEMVVVVEGHDKTKKIVEKLSKKYKQIKCYYSAQKLGKGGAIKKGFGLAKGDKIGFTDADDSIGPIEFEKIINSCTDCTIASRRIKGAIVGEKPDAFRNIGSIVFNYLVRFMFWLDLKDTQCGAKVFSKKAIDDVLPELKTNGFEFDVELLWRIKRHGFEIKEIPIKWVHQDNSSFSLKEAPMMFVGLIKTRLNYPKFKKKKKDMKDRIKCFFEKFKNSLKRDKKEQSGHFSEKEAITEKVKKYVVVLKNSFCKKTHWFEKSTKKESGKRKETVKEKLRNFYYDFKIFFLIKIFSIKHGIEEFKKKSLKEKSIAIAKSSYFHVFVLVVLSSFILFHNLGTSSLLGDESIHAQVSKEFLKTGDWFNTYWKGEIFLDKPPLELWLTGTIFKFFGINEFNARFCSAFAALLTIVLVYFLGRKLFNKYVGFLASLMLMTCTQYLFEHCARTGETDGLLVFLITLSLFSFIKAKESPKYYYLSAISIGLGILTKSVAGALPIFIIILYLILTKNLKILKNKHFLLSSPLVLLFSVPWFLSQYLLYKDKYLYAMNKDVIIRATQEYFGHYSQTYYLHIINAGFYPWALFALFAIIYGLVNIFKNKKRQEYLFLLSWIFVVFTIFTYAKGQTTNYIIPLYPALCILIAKLSYDFIHKTKNILIQTLMFLPITALFVTIISKFQFDPHYPKIELSIKFINDYLLNQTYLSKAVILTVLLFFVINLVIKYTANKTIMRFIPLLIITYLILISSHIAVSTTYHTHIIPIHQFVNDLKSTNHNDYEIISYFKKTDISAWDYYYLDSLNGEKKYTTNKKEIINALNSNKSVFILMKADKYNDIKKIKPVDNSTAMYHMKKYYYTKDMIILTNDVDAIKKFNFRWSFISKTKNISIQYPKKINFNNQIEFLGYDLNRKMNNKSIFEIYTPGDNRNLFRITYYWKSLKSVNESYKVFVHFLNESRDIVFGYDHMPFYDFYDTSKWKPGEIIKETYDVRIWDEIKPDEYFIKVGLYNEKGRLPRIDQNYELLNQTPKIQNPQNINYNNTFEFLGYDLNKTKIEQKEKFKINYYWTCLNKTDQNYMIFVHFRNDSGKSGFQNDHMPSIPTSQWKEGQIFKETQTVISNDAIGEYSLNIGFYIPEKGRIPVIGETQKINKTLLNIIIQESNISNKALDIYDDKIIFLGHNLDKKELKTGDSFKITGFWKSIDKININYTVFVHFLDEKNKVTFQQDHEPEYVVYPTSQWNIGEIIKEEYNINVPTVKEGNYKIKIGLYDKKTGERLYLVNGKNSQIIGNITVIKSDDYIFEIIPKTNIEKPKVSLDEPDIIGTLEVK